MHAPVRPFEAPPHDPGHDPHHDAETRSLYRVFAVAALADLALFALLFAWTQAV